MAVNQIKLSNREAYSGYFYKYFDTLIVLLINFTEIGFANPEKVFFFSLVILTAILRFVNNVNGFVVLRY